MRSTHALITLVSLISVSLGAFCTTPCLCSEVRSSVDFTIANPGPSARHEYVRVSIPTARGLLPGAPPMSVTVEGQAEVAQARIITTHPDGSARRVMLTFPVELGPGQTVRCSYGEIEQAPVPLAPVLQRAPQGVRVRTTELLALCDGRAVQFLNAEGEVIAIARAFGPGAAAPTMEIIENGPCFGWVRWRQEGQPYTREVDLQVDASGEIRLTQRLLRTVRDDEWTPDFGFEVSGVGAEVVQGAEQPVGFLKLDPKSGFLANPELTTSLRLSDGLTLSMTNPLAFRQLRGSVAVQRGDGAVTVRASRIEPTDDPNNRLLSQEGAWQFVELVISPREPEQLAEQLDYPLITKVDWEAFDAVYRTGPPLRVEDPLLQRLVEAYIETMVSLARPGDDLGNPGGLDRYNHCGYVWADYSRTGDPRLLRMALEWSANYNDYSVYWGPNEDYYGGGRYPNDPSKQPWPGNFRPRYNNSVSFCTKGYHSFWLAYEQTGDPRFRYAAEQQAKWSSTHVYANRGEMRNIGMVADYVHLYEYTGERLYLEQAERLWGEFQERQTPDLLFTQSGAPATGNDLHIYDDESGYSTPFVKAYIVQYATNSLPLLYRHHPNDTRLRDTIIALNDWMAKVQTPGGGWGYPGPSTGGLGWNLEYCHGLALGYALEPRGAYLDAIQRELRAIAVLYDAYGAIPSGIEAWESVAGIPGEQLRTMYHYATDRDRGKDFTNGRVGFGVGPDQTVHFQVLLREYLAHRSEQSLFADDPALAQILRLPASIPGGEPQEGDPNLRIVASQERTKRGTLVALQAQTIWQLRGRTLRYHWCFPDGSALTGERVGKLFPSSGAQRIELVACDGEQTFTHAVTVTTPTGPGDLGLAEWPSGLRIQAEAYVASGGDATTPLRRRPREAKLGSDEGSISHWNDLGAWLEWELPTRQPGRYFLLVRYARPDTGEREVAVDGAPVGRLALSATGGFGGPGLDQWATTLLAGADGRPLPLALTAGARRLRLTNTDGKGCNLDYLELLEAPLASAAR